MNNPFKTKKHLFTVYFLLTCSLCWRMWTTMMSSPLLAVVVSSATTGFYNWTLKPPDHPGWPRFLTQGDCAGGERGGRAGVHRGGDPQLGGRNLSDLCARPPQVRLIKCKYKHKHKYKYHYKMNINKIEYEQHMATFSSWLGLQLSLLLWIIFHGLLFEI